MGVNPFRGTLDGVGPENQFGPKKLRFSGPTPSNGPSNGYFFECSTQIWWILSDSYYFSKTEGNFRKSLQFYISNTGRNFRKSLILIL
jgi:hypothetical protein